MSLLTTQPSGNAPARFIGDAVVEANRPLCRDHFLLTLRTDHFPAAQPGQFVQVLCRPSLEHCTGAYLRRPFSIAALRRTEASAELDILHRVVGPGTAYLAGLRSGDRVNVIGPLGHGFEPPVHMRTAYLVGGGVGLPPLLWLARELTAAGTSAVLFAGARTADLMPLTRADGRPLRAAGLEAVSGLREIGEPAPPVILATDDGSLGFAGTAVAAARAFRERHGTPAAGLVMFACGPEPMLRAAAHLADEWGVPCQVCLERVMACGFGTCQSCVVRVRRRDPPGWRYALCCRDGPVFAHSEVIWNG